MPDDDQVNADKISHEKTQGEDPAANENSHKGVDPAILARTLQDVSIHTPAHGVSEYSHQQLAPQPEQEKPKQQEDDWQEMPAFAQYDLYDDDGRLIAKQADHQDDDGAAAYAGLGGAGKGYTRVEVDEDAQSATSMDDNTAYLFKEPGDNLIGDDEDDDQRDPLAQMQATKDLLDGNQRVAYVGVVRLAIADMTKHLVDMERTKATRKQLDMSAEAIKMWGQKMMVRLYAHMELDPAEQMMIEQLAEHGLQASDLTPSLMQNARVKNPVADDSKTSAEETLSSPSPTFEQSQTIPGGTIMETEQLPAYKERDEEDIQEVLTPSQLPRTKSIDIDLRWTVLCDLFLILIADSVYDARSRTLLERVGSYLAVPWLDISRFEKRVTEALEMQESVNKETWDEAAHMEDRRKRARNRRLMMMGLATVGGSLVIGLSAGLLAPVIGAGLAAGFTTIGVTGTSSFLAGVGGAAVIGSTGVVTGGTIGVRAANRRTGAVKTFEYRPLHNNKRVNLIVTVAGWLNGKVDDVRLPFSTVDPVMGDIYSIHWEPDMLTSMGQTIQILATEALTQGLQQLLGSTILITLMAALQLPVVLTKLSYFIDNPWSVSLARADLAGLILADSLIDRNLGARPITLVGFSIGSRVIFSALKELSKKGAIGIIQNVYLFGSPIVFKKDEYLQARSIVSGRFVNGYATNDWILGYLFRATGGGISRVTGLAKVELPDIENFDVTEFVPGHMAYRKAMPRVLREVGWAVSSDEFSEIEDPDPDNHEKRQRELINEIEEARRELQQKPEKKKFFGIFKTKKDLTKKKEWETYDEHSKTEADGEDSKRNNGEGPLFDIDAIRAEAVELASQGMEVRQLESTLPPLKLDSSKFNGNNGQVCPRPTTLRETSSYVAASPQSNVQRPTVTTAHGLNGNDNKYSPIRHDAHPSREDAEQDITMTFDTSFSESHVLAQRQSSRQSKPFDTGDISSYSLNHEKEEEEHDEVDHHADQTSGKMKSTTFDPENNVWSDEEDFGLEKEVEMTFA